MKSQVNFKKIALVEDTSESHFSTLASETFPLSPPRRHQELLGRSPQTQDVLKQLRRNIQSIEDLQFRLNFMMKEITGRVKR